MPLLIHEESSLYLPIPAYLPPPPPMPPPPVGVGATYGGLPGGGDGGDVHAPQSSFCQLLRVHSTIDEFELVDVPDLQAEVGLLFEELRSTALEPNLKFPLKENLKTNSEDQLKINSEGADRKSQNSTVKPQNERQ